MPLVPGSFSTMISVEESEENKNEGDSRSGPVEAPTSPCFADTLSSGESSEYDTDLEEEFPGKVCVKTIMCNVRAVD